MKCFPICINFISFIFEDSYHRYQTSYPGIIKIKTHRAQGTGDIDRFLQETRASASEWGRRKKAAPAVKRSFWYDMASCCSDIKNETIQNVLRILWCNKSPRQIWEFESWLQTWYLFIQGPFCFNCQKKAITSYYKKCIDM